MFNLRQLISYLLAKMSLFFRQIKKSKKKLKENQLIYRGVNYEFKPPVEITETEVIGKYRGVELKKHPLKKALIFKPQNTFKYKNLKYRGVNYSKNTTSIYDDTETEISYPSSTIINKTKPKNQSLIFDNSNEQKNDSQTKSISNQKKHRNNPIEIKSGQEKLNYPQETIQIPNHESYIESITRLRLERDVFREKPISTSGEGKIWTISVSREVAKWLKKSHNYLAKIYHEPTPERIKKLEVMVNNHPNQVLFSESHNSVAWAKYILEDIDGEAVGFLMPKISEAKQLIEVYNPQKRLILNLEYYWQVDWRFLHLTAINIAYIIQHLHSQNYIVGDLKQDNILVNKKALPSIIDTDSFQITDPKTGDIYPCNVGSEGFTPPELLGQELSKTDQNHTHDNFRLAVIIYHLLFGLHPFKGKWIGSEAPPEIDTLIALNYWPYAPNSLMQLGISNIPLEIVHPEIKKCFLKCFNDGHHNPDLRPNANDWFNALQIGLNDLVQCETISSHWYSKAYGKCYWCEAKNNLRYDRFDVIDSSARYKILIKLLKEEKWKEADLETKYLMLKITGRMNKGWLDESAIKNFPVDELKTIDEFWQNHSNQHFGFSVQKRIYLDTNNKLGEFNRETYNHFGEMVGWRDKEMWKNYRDLEFSLNAPKGHLPFCCSAFNVCLVSYISYLIEGKSLR